ncbi:hypothetical protein [Halobacterium sp. CBA1126]|uniref:hypothetical protein n=1 Tax=Halobacterium sp. CBA1126 TaxID=2668074 RepID=UPI0012F9B3E8|nr:hypothetical protein [Halobacterium sp. CBA1126]MUV59973.1 hypothetical protein [Halobacterium sp. CBA1126]
MNRRRFLATTGTAGLLGLAGCSSLPGMNSCSGTPEYDYEWQAEGFVGRGFEPTIILTGRIESQSDNCSLDEVEVTADVLDSSGSEIMSKSTIVRQIAPRDEEKFIIWFYPSQNEVDRVDGYHVSAEVPDSD